MKIFDRETCVSIVLTDESEAVRLAAEDLRRDLRRLSRTEHDFPIVTDTGESGTLRIATVSDGRTEGYTVSVTENEVRIMGSDTLGTVYGIYAFMTRCLSVLPVHRLVDVFPAATETLTVAPTEIVSGERRVRFRGWFLNDEDLLTEFRYSGGKRKIDYPFYADVVDVSVLDMILETALRLEVNLVIPASFVDIRNPAEEALVKAVTRRGLYVSQHHVEPVGVSYFGAEGYLASHGHADEAVSFIGNRARMEEIWRHYIEAWAKYGDRVVWQLGLRGKADAAVWKHDPSVPISMEARGGIITDAIATQHRMICETLGSDRFYSTATLWNEGSELYSKGYLRMPAGTVPIFADFGLDQMFGEDFFGTAREKDRNYGIYYHAGFWQLGPHLTEGCNPVKMAYCYREAAERNTLFYSILNISNVRPLHLSAVMNAEILADPTAFDAKKATLRFDEALFGATGKDVNALRRAYYEAFADFGEAPMRAAMEAWHYAYHDYGELPFLRNAATDGQLTYYGKYVLMHRPYEKIPKQDRETLRILQESAERFSVLYNRAEALEAVISEDKRLYFAQFVKYQILHMLRLTEWCVFSMGLVSETRLPAERERCGRAACDALRSILEERRILECGAWEHWHRGDKKVNIPALLRLTEETLTGVIENA